MCFFKGKSYKKYDLKIKKLIARSRNPYLFPELEIPRTTANYWIKKGVRSFPEE